MKHPNNGKTRSEGRSAGGGSARRLTRRDSRRKGGGRKFLKRKREEKTTVRSDAHTHEGSRDDCRPRLIERIKNVGGGDNGDEVL